MGSFQGSIPGPSFVAQICARGLVDTLFRDLGFAGEY